jgi:dimethylhistidine N-methyltransferase
MKTDIYTPAVLSPLPTAEMQAFAQDILQGLGRNPKRLSSKYFYDGQGSRLFQKIMELPEYYLTRAETEIFTQQQTSINNQFTRNGPFNLVDLGAGDAAKTKILLHPLVQNKVDFTYIPIDISADALNGLSSSLAQELPELRVKPIAGDYFKSLEQLQNASGLRKVVLFLGSNIGNFPAAEIRVFLSKLRQYMHPGDQLLIGFDLKKDPHLIRRAYDDNAGVTAAFNFNLLHRINQTFGGNFDLNNFQHFAEYNPVSGEMRSYLVSTREQKITLKDLNASFVFQAWETLHTESSYKFSEAEIQDLAQETGLHLRLVFTDTSHYFADVLFDIQ